MVEANSLASISTWRARSFHRDAAQVCALNVQEPVQARLAQINDWLGDEVVKFRPYKIPVQE